MKGTPLDEATHQYIVERFASEEARLLTRMGEAATRAGMPRIMVSEDQARLLKVLCELVGAKRCLDIGTLFGYSAAAMALSLPTVRVTTLESEPVHARVARENFGMLGIADRVEVLEGPALASLKSLRGPFDLALIDADKDGYKDYYEACLRLVRPGGLVLADNALAFGHVAQPASEAGQSAHDVRSIQVFNDHVAGDPRVDAALVPVGDGFVIARVKT